MEIPHAGPVEVVVRNPRLVCFGTGLPTAHVHHGATQQLPARARWTTRLKTALPEAVIDSGRAVAEVGTDFRGAWWPVQAVVNAWRDPLTRQGTAVT